MWHSLKRGFNRAAPEEWSSSEWIESRKVKGVWFRIARISFLRRLELLKRLRGLLAELECRAASEANEDQVEASRIGMEVQRTYLEWGLIEIAGLKIDGEPARKETLLAQGPEWLCEEIADAVKEHSFLSDSERKN